MAAPESLSGENAVADEFLQDGILRHQIIVGWAEIADQLQDTLRFQIAGLLWTDRRQLVFDQRTQHRQLLEQGGVDEKIDLLLIRKDIAVLTAADFIPVIEGSGGTQTA